MMCYSLTNTRTQIDFLLGLLPNTILLSLSFLFYPIATNIVDKSAACKKQREAKRRITVNKDALCIYVYI